MAKKKGKNKRPSNITPETSGIEVKVPPTSLPKTAGIGEEALAAYNKLSPEEKETAWETMPSAQQNLIMAAGKRAAAAQARQKLSPEEQAKKQKELENKARGIHPKVTPLPPRAAPGGLLLLSERLAGAKPEYSESDEKLDTVAEKADRDALTAKADAEEKAAKATEESTKAEKDRIDALRKSSKEIRKQTREFELLSKNIDLALGSTKVPGKKGGLFSPKGMLEAAGISESSTIGGMLHKAVGDKEERDLFVKQRQALGMSKGEAKIAHKKIKIGEKELAGLVGQRNELMAGPYGHSEETMTKMNIEAEKKEPGSGLQTKILAKQAELVKLRPDLEEKIERNRSMYGEYDTDRPSRDRRTVRRERIKPGPERAEVAGDAAENVSRNSAADEEAIIDQNKMIEEQTELLKEIRDNTGGKTPVTKGGTETPGKGGGFLDGVGKGLNSLGKGLKGLGEGAGKGIKGFLTGLAEGIAKFGTTEVLKGAAAMIVLAGALYIVAKALKEFNNIDWESLAKGALAMGGLALAAYAISKIEADILLGAAAMIVLAGALWILSEALLNFNDIKWESMLKGVVAIAGFAAAITLLGLALTGPQAVFFAAGIVALLAMGAALVVFGEGLKFVSEGIDSFVDGMSRLDEIDGDNLLKVAEGLLALSGAMAAFGAAQAVAGLGSLVGRFLTLGTDSPVDQLIKIGNHGEGVLKAAEGMERLGGALAKFAKIDKGSMDAINDFPWIRATAFVAAGGSMQVAGASVSNIKEGPKTATTQTTDKEQVAGEDVISGQPLSQKQAAVVDMSKSMGNTPSPAVLAAYEQYQASKPKQVTPNAADIVTGKTEENISGATMPTTDASTTIVSSPTINNRTNMIQPRRSAHNEYRGYRGSNEVLA